jgi:hypothetical protein
VKLARSVATSGGPDEFENAPRFAGFPPKWTRLKVARTHSRRPDSHEKEIVSEGGLLLS